MNLLQTMIRRFQPTQTSGDRLGPDLGAGLDVYGGCEMRVPSHGYRWDGLRRGRTSRFAVVQYTLAGRGAFDVPGRHVEVGPEECFFAIVPSAHVYYLPDDSPDWTFVWVLIDHPYVVERLARIVNDGAPVVRARAGTDLPETIAGLLEQRSRPAVDEDRFSRERRLFDLVIAAERAAHAQQHGTASERDHLLTRTRQIVEANGMARPNVDDVAAEFGMSRSNFSHHFRAVTGLTPAAFVRELRLSRARDQLIGSDATLKAISHGLGFADVNHFCKAFRGRFGFTPGAFRRQVRGRWRAPTG